MKEDILKIAKKVVVEGVKTVTIGAGVTLATTIVREGLDGAMKLDVTKLLK